MANRQGIENQLNELRLEISALSSLPAISPSFAVWLGKLFAVVETGFGIDSDEMRQLRAICPEVSPEFYDSVAARLARLDLNEELGNQLVAKLNTDVPQVIFKRRLYEYDDLIGAMINGLQTT